MGRAVAISTGLVLLATLAILAPLTSADTVIESRDIELLEAGSFDDPDVWDITTKKAFSDDSAEHSVGMVADGELSFTHDRPDNFQTYTAWASYSPTNSNSSIGEPDGYYTWSKGPDISLSGYAFDGLHSRLIANVSMVLHISVPDALPSDEIRITIEANGPERLVRTIARTFGPINRMTTPMVESMDGLQEWTWSDLEAATVIVDYVSDGAPDDSEVRVDAVGIRVKYHQPWYSFETVKAIHEISGQSMPYIEFGPYDGEQHGLNVESCGLTRDIGGVGIWEFNVSPPQDQELGRIHVFGSGNWTIESPSGMVAGSDELMVTLESGDLIPVENQKTEVKISLEDGCIEKVRIDVNDPHLVVSGSVAGAVDGLTEGYSTVRFAVGNTLVEQVNISLGSFDFEVPIGHALPSDGESLLVGIAARFQWSSDGMAETTVVHIDSMSISGGYHLEWDTSVSCSAPSNLQLMEDGGGVLLPMASRCEDDRTAWEDLDVSASTHSTDLIDVSTHNGNIRIQPRPNAYGEARVNVEVKDETWDEDNKWTGWFTVTITGVDDPPSIEGLPVSTYINLGHTRVIDLRILDPDSPELAISTSRSWATIDAAGDLILTPVEPGTHSVEVSVSDDNFTVSQSIEVIVTAQPDLTVENIEVWKGSTSIDSVDEGDVVQIKVYVRNEGRGVADAVDVRCWVDGMLVGSTMIDSIAPGGLAIGTCDTQIINHGTVVIRAMVDGTASLEESNEENNEMSISVDSEERKRGGGSGGVDRGPALIVASIGVIAISFAALQFSPGRVRKPYRKK